METKMKKIPFDLERAKKGEAFRISDQDYSDNYYVSNNSSEIIAKWLAEGLWNRCSFDLANVVKEGWYHLIPDEPKPERWITMPNDASIYKTRKEAEDIMTLANINGSHTVVKLADDEIH